MSFLTSGENRMPCFLFSFSITIFAGSQPGCLGKKKALIEKRVSASICYFGHLPCINWFVFFSDQLSLLAFSSVFWFDPCRWLSITQLLSHSLPACVLSTLFCSQIQNMALCVLLWRKWIPSKPDPVHSGKEYSLEIILNILI